MQPTFAAIVAVYFAASAFAVPSLVPRADPAAGLVTNTTAYAEYCFAKNPDYKDRRACFQIDGDIRKRMVSSYDIRGFTTEDGSCESLGLLHKFDRKIWSCLLTLEHQTMIRKFLLSCPTKLETKDVGCSRPTLTTF